MHFTTALVAAKRSVLLGAALVGLAVGDSAFAANTTFTAGGSALWTTSGNWSGGAPTASDVAVFGTGAGSIVRVTGTQAVAGLLFNNTNAVQLTGTSGNAFLEVGAQGIIVESGAGIITLGTNTNNFRLGVRLTASHTWENRKAASAGETLLRSPGASAGIDLQSFTLTFDGSGYTNIQGPVTGSGGFVKNGSGAVNISTDNPVFTGGVVLNSGLLQLNASSSGTTSGPLGNPLSSVLTVNGGTMTARGNAGTTRTVSNNMVWGGDFTVQPPPTVAVVNLLLTGSTTLSGTNTVRTVTVLGTGSGTPIFSVGPIGDGGNNVGLTKSGTGLLVFLGDNTYTGLTTVSSGTLQVGSILAGGTAGSIAGDILLNGAATQLVIERSTGATLGGDISGSGSIVKNGAGSLSLTGSNSYSGSLTVNQGVLGIGSVDALPGWDTTGRYTISGSAGITFGNAVTEGQIATILSGTAGTVSPDAVSGLDTSAGDRTFTGDLAAAFPGRNVVKTGANALVLTGSSTLTGGKSVSVFSGGSLRIGDGGTLASDVTVLTGGTLQVGGPGAGTLTGSVTIQPGAVGQVGDGGTTGSIVGAVANSGTLTFNRSDDITFADQISGTGRLVKVGSGRLTLPVANSGFTGPTSITAGTLRVDAGGALGTGQVSAESGAATSALELEGGATLANLFTIGGRATPVVSLRNVSGTNTMAGQISIVGGGGGYAMESLAGRLRLSGTIAAAGSAANTSRTLTLGGDGDIEIVNGIPAAGTTSISISKSGAGTLFFGGSRTMPGTTTISAGRLFMNAGSVFAAPTGSAVTIGAAAALAGSGTISGPVTISGLHEPGSSPGLQTFTGGLAYGSTATLAWELIDNTDAGRGTLFDAIDLTTGGSLSIDALATISLTFDAPGSTVAWSNAFWAADREWKVIGVASPVTWGGTPFGTIVTGNDSEDVALDTVRPDASFALDARDGDGLYLTYTAVPEPSTMAMLAGVAFSCLAARRLRRVARAG